MNHLDDLKMTKVVLQFCKKLCECQSFSSLNKISLVVHDNISYYV